MSAQQTVALARATLETALWMAAPVLVLATLVSLLINIMQVLTSLQEPTLATVPRLAAVATALFWLLPWMVRRLTVFTILQFSDFHPLVR